MLGHGGFGITYLGHDRNLDKAVAVKEYLPVDLAGRTAEGNVAPQAEACRDDFDWGLERFLDEARFLAQFKHPNIIRVHRFFKANGAAYIVMEYAEGETLAERLKREGTLDEKELKAILLPLLDGLAQLHDAGVLHRDVKPANIMLREADDSPALVDFGSARQATGARSRSMTAVVMPGYGPLEQYSTRAGRQGPWTDLYALGGVCYRVLTGNAPAEATERMRNDPQEPAVEAARGKAAPAFLQAIDWALQVNESDRPQDAAAWQAALLGEEAPAEDTAAQADKPSPSASPVDGCAIGCAAPFFIGAIALGAEGPPLAAVLIVLVGVAVLAGAAGVTPGSGAPATLFSALSESDVAAETIQALIARGADVNATDEDGATPLRIAVENNESPEVVRALLAGGAYVNAKDEHDMAPLHTAAENSENPEVIRTLLDGGANANARDEHGMTPLHAAAGRNIPPEIIRALLARGADVNAADEFRNGTPLHWAVRDSEAPEIIKALLESGADATARDNKKKPRLIGRKNKRTWWRRRFFGPGWSPRPPPPATRPAIT